MSSPCSPRITTRIVGDAAEIHIRRQTFKEAIGWRSGGSFFFGVVAAVVGVLAPTVGGGYAWYRTHDLLWLLLPPLMTVMMTGLLVGVVASIAREWVIIRITPQFLSIETFNGDGVSRKWPLSDVQSVRVFRGPGDGDHAPSVHLAVCSKDREEHFLRSLTEKELHDLVAVIQSGMKQISSHGG